MIIGHQCESVSFFTLCISGTSHNATCPWKEKKKRKINYGHQRRAESMDQSAWYFFSIILLHFVINKKGKDIYRKMYRKSLVFWHLGMRKFITGDHVLNFAAAASSKQRQKDCISVNFGGEKKTLGGKWKSHSMRMYNLNFSIPIFSALLQELWKEKIFKKQKNKKNNSKTKTFVTCLNIWNSSHC